MALFRRRRPTLADDWEAIAARRLGHWAQLDLDERRRLAPLVAGLVTTKRWEAAQGFELTDEVRTVIAARAALLVLDLEAGLDAYRDVATIIVHASSLRFRQVSDGPVPGTEVEEDVDLLGEASYDGPVVIAWDAARRDARHPQRGRDVVLHEFAHKLDMLDAVVDGTPPLPDESARRRWIEVCSRELELLRAGAGGHVLDPYGATDPGEFFAVATEAFFTVPRELEREKPELYAVLQGFYRQDPAGRARRHELTA